MSRLTRLGREADVAGYRFCEAIYKVLGFYHETLQAPQSDT